MRQIVRLLQRYKFIRRFQIIIPMYKRVYSDSVGVQWDNVRFVLWVPSATKCLFIPPRMVKALKLLNMDSNLTYDTYADLVKHENI